MADRHNHIIANAALSALGPLGFNRKGRSRTWIADHDWWVAVVEFQPSSWSKGCYLNVAAHWLWSSEDHISFDFGDRVGGFAEYSSDDDFAEAMHNHCLIAVQEVQRHRSMFADLRSTADVLLAEVRASRHHGWTTYHAGIVAGLLGETELAWEMFDCVLRECKAPHSLICARAERMAGVLIAEASLTQEVAGLVEQHRAALKLTAQNAGSLAPFLSSSGVTAV